MRGKETSNLERLGLSAAEAQVYLALLRNGGTLGATALAGAMGVQRTTVYPTLTSLTQKGMVEAGAGYGSRFTAVRPDEALPLLIAREREELLQRERLAEEELLQRKRLAGELVKQLDSLVKSAENHGEAELIQVIRDLRAVAQRYDRLRLQAQQSVEVFVKAPIFSRPGPDPVLEELLRRGVLCRGLYERATLDSPAVGPYLAKWVADGDEVRVYDGNLPHKLALFDRQSAFVALSMPGDQMRTVYIRHPELANSLGILFDTFWEKSEPLTIADQKKSPGDTGAIRIRKRTGNGQASRSRK